MKPLYFDHNATTPILPEVFEAMEPFLRGSFGNPSSPHPWGLEAKEALERARRQVAACINAQPEEIVFTSCATESNHMVFSGLFGHSTRGRIVTSTVEHPSVLAPIERLEKRGVRVVRLPVDENGRVSVQDAKDACTPDTELVSVMLANNEVGTIQPVAQFAPHAESLGALVHTDASQAVGKIRVDVRQLDVDFLTIAGHKLYAPKGIGALYIRSVRTLPPLLLGGGQERGMRSGTENVAFAVALGKACEIAGRTVEDEGARQRALGDVLVSGLRELGHKHLPFATGADRLPNTLAVGFRGVDAGRIVEGLALADVGVSAGAACHGDSTEISPVLRAMGVDPEYARGAIRFSWGRSTTEEDVRDLLGRLKGVLDAL